MSVYYVDNTGGSNSNTGLSEAQAWETIVFAQTQITTGDIVNLRAGTYVEQLFWFGGPSGLDWVTPIRFQSYPGETATIRPGAGSEFALAMRASGSGTGDAPHHIIFDRIVFDGFLTQFG